MTDKTDLIREILEYVTAHGGENTATHLLVLAASAIQAQAAEPEAVGAGGVQALSAAPAEQQAPALRRVERTTFPSGPAHRALHAFVSAMHDNHIKGDDMRAAMLWFLGYEECDATLQQAAPKAAPGEPSAFPMTGDEEESDLGQWQPGTAKPNMDGTYLREFDEGEATSEFHQGVWLRDGFSPSDLQDVRWRGRAAPQQEAQEPTAISEAIERMAADRYKVVPSHESMFHRWAVVAGTGTQQLYLGREVECQNMARKFAGAFLDGAFVAMQQAAPQPAPAPLSDDTKDAARWRWLSEHIGVAWNEGKFTSLVRIVSDKNRAALNASIDRMMTGDWSDAALAAQERQP